MKRLFWRIFIPSWIAMMVVGVGFSLWFLLRIPAERTERRRERTMQIYTLQGEELVRTLQHEGEGAARDHLDSFGFDTPARFWLLHDTDIRLASTDAPLPEALGALLDTATPEGHLSPQQGTDLIALALRDSARQYGTWSLLISAPQRVFIQRSLARESQRFILIAIIAGILSFLLARYISRPLLKLRRATDEIAGGDFSVRISPELTRESLEIAALGRDFDTMAARIELLLESQKRLLRDVSHELRSPLARMGVALELARNKSGEAAHPMLDRIERDALRLGELISEILDLTRLDAGDPGGVISVMPLADLGALIGTIASDVAFEAQASDKDLHLAAEDLDQRPITVRPELIRRAVENIMRNAIRHTPEGSAVTCTLSLRAAPHPASHQHLFKTGAPSTSSRHAASYLVLKVRDQGPGIPEDLLKDIFRPFVRVESARDRHSGGAGIGLAIVESAIRLHGGEISAENVDPGLEITLSLPIPSA